MDPQTLAKAIEYHNPKGIVHRDGFAIALTSERSQRILRHYATQRRVTNPSRIVAMALHDLQGRNAHAEEA
jgi:hypothetical protein